MQSIFDWIRFCRTGGEVIATLEYFKHNPVDRLAEIKALAGPITADQAPCSRCWRHPAYSRKAGAYRAHCRTCEWIVKTAGSRSQQSSHSIVIWGHVDRLPEHLVSQSGLYGRVDVLSHHTDSRHFLLVMDRRTVREWIRETMLYHGSDLKGFIQCFPTSGQMVSGNMGERICVAAHYDNLFPMDRLLIRLYVKTQYLDHPSRFQNKGIFTYAVQEFIRMLDMAAIFRSLLNPQEQELLKTLAAVKSEDESRFSWGRLIGALSPEARDMLSSWNFRSWTQDQIATLYAFFDYVDFTAA